MFRNNFESLDASENQETNPEGLTEQSPDVLADMPKKPEPYPLINLDQNQKEELRDTIKEVIERVSEDNDD